MQANQAALEEPPRRHTVPTDQQAPFTAGDLVLIPPGIPHEWQFDPAQTDRHGYIENITLIFEENWLQKLAETFPPLDTIISRLHTYTDAVTFPTRRQEHIGHLLQRMCNETATTRAASLISLLDCIAEEGQSLGHYHKPDPTEQRLMQTRIYVSCNFRHSISLDEIARHLGMNRSAFCTFFRKHTGQTFTDYLNAYRVKQAHRMLVEEQRPVGETCYACGFNDVAYFCRTFRRYKGFPPSQAAKAARSTNTTA